MVPYTRDNPANGTVCLLEPTGHQNTGPALRDTPAERLAELVHHLSDAPLVEARRAVHHHRAIGLTDPLAVVASALVELRAAARSRDERATIADGASKEQWPTMW